MTNWVARLRAHAGVLSINSLWTPSEKVYGCSASSTNGPLTPGLSFGARVAVGLEPLL